MKNTSWLRSAPNAGFSPISHARNLLQSNANATARILHLPDIHHHHIHEARVISPDSPEWFNVDAGHYHRPSPEQFRQILEQMKKKAAPDDLAKLNALSIGTVPHPLYPKESLATLEFAASPGMSPAIRGKKLYLANVSLTREQLLVFNYGIGKVNLRSIRHGVPHIHKNVKKPFSPLYGNLEAFQSEYIKNLWGKLPSWSEKNWNEWNSIFEAIPGSMEDKLKLLNIPLAGSINSDTLKISSEGVCANLWTARGDRNDLMPYLLIHRGHKRSAIIEDGKGLSMSARTWAKHAQ